MRDTNRAYPPRARTASPRRGRRAPPVNRSPQTGRRSQVRPRATMDRSPTARASPARAGPRRPRLSRRRSPAPRRGTAAGRRGALRHRRGHRPASTARSAPPRVSPRSASSLDRRRSRRASRPRRPVRTGAGPPASRESGRVHRHRRRVHAPGRRDAARPRQQPAHGRPRRSARARARCSRSVRRRPVAAGTDGGTAGDGRRRRDSSDRRGGRRAGPRRPPATVSAGSGSGVTWSRFAQQATSGLVFGSLLALASIGLSLIFGTTGLSNFAHGEQVTLGGILAYVGTSRRSGCRSWSAGDRSPSCSRRRPGWVQDRFLWHPLRSAGSGSRSA